MYIFLLMNLFLGFYFKSNSFAISLFQSDYFLYITVPLLTVNFVVMWVQSKKIPINLQYDLFAVGSILIWLSYWPPFFREESPLFYVFSLYFSFITAFFSLLFKTQKENMSIDEIKNLQMLSNFKISSPFFIMAAVLISLAFPEHFLLFPLTITLLIIRFSLANCLAIK